MKHIIFKRNRFTPFYATIGERSNLKSMIVLNSIISLKDINIEYINNENKLVNILEEYESMLTDDKKYEIVKYPPVCNIITKHQFPNIYHKRDLINTETIEFDIDCNPYDVGEVVYVSFKNEFHKLLSRYRDDFGNWIYTTELYNNIGSNKVSETYTDEEKFNFETIKHDNNELIKQRNIELENNKRDAIEQIHKIIKYYEEHEQNNYKNVLDDKCENIGWVKKLINKIKM